MDGSRWKLRRAGLRGFVRRSGKLLNLRRVSSETELTNLPLISAARGEELSVEQSQQQLQRVLQSNTLRNSPTLQQLLQFLGTRGLDGNPEGLKEYTIGVEAFGRKPDFDPKTDTIVRVQTHRLRQKLKEYYEQEGIRDHILIEIPKGHYYPAFRLRAGATESAEAGGESSGGAPASTEVVPAAEGALILQPESRLEAVSGPVGDSRWGWLWSGPVVATAVVLLAIAVGYLAGNLQARTAVSGVAATAVPFHRYPADPVKSFWAALIGNDPSPIIAYPNAVFLLDDSNDLFRFRQGASDNRGARVDPHLAKEFASNPALVASAGQLYYEDGYTGTGELEGVAMLAGLFAQMGLTPTIKTSRNITPEDLQQHTVILLGSPFQNIAVAQLMAAGDFRFDNPDSRREEWRASIVNSRPLPGESAAYHTERDPETEVLKLDYSLISIQPGVVAGHNIAVLGGLDTKGTEGVTRFITSRAGVESLTAALAAKGLKVSRGGGGMPWFQALVQVHLEKGDQVLSTELAAVHPFPLGGVGGVIAPAAAKK